MLEFQEGFFDQEVRDGFYLDTTMKTLWAAELEVLQKVAEVCDRHGLKWYAAYGTLLGAIRHEGFVPWDDDMDIWVKRPDYNILMQVLPKELPEGYLVRGPLTDEGYDQFHTCLNNGNGISIAKEWLEQYHGCPFTVGLDIFPLDYLPRNEKDRELQVTLLAMTGRIAQLAKNVARGDYNPKDSDTEQKSNKSAKKNKKGRKKKVKTQKEEVIEEINLGISYLEKNCNLQIDHQLLKDEDWYRVSSELWKWANYLAMMYGEDEGDYIVEMFDYIQCPHKVYPKEWFADGYSATFENFMIPIPAGYDQILKYIYGLTGNYLVHYRKTGTHEYPYYARQLRQLREYVKDIQQRARDAKLVPIESIKIKEDTKELPPEWLPLTIDKNGIRKKIILSANDPAFYTEHGIKALDKLESTLHTFEQAKEYVLLWWRPHPLMKKILDQVSGECGNRYLEILNTYRKAGWGICDETDNIDRAVSFCDIYYGEMNAVLQPFQDAEKPIVLLDAGNNKQRNENSKRINEYRAFISFFDFAEDENRIYFSNTTYNAFVAAEKSTGIIIKHIPFEGYATNTRCMHCKCVQWQGQILFLPATTQYLYRYDMKNGELKRTDFLKHKDESKIFQGTWEYFRQNDYLYLLPWKSAQGLWCLTAKEEDPSQERWWLPSPTAEALGHGVIDQDCFYSFEHNSNRLFITNVKEQVLENFLLPDEYVQNVTYDGNNFWYTVKGASDIVCWNPKAGIIDRYFVPYDNYYIIESSYGAKTYCNIHYASEHLFLLSGNGMFLYVLDQRARALRCLHRIQCNRGEFNASELSAHFKHRGNSLLCMLQDAGEILVINLTTLKVVQIAETFQVKPPLKDIIWERTYKLLLDRNALLYTKGENNDIAWLLRYCTEKTVLP